MIDYIRRHYGTENLVVVSPDAGGAKRYVEITLFTFLEPQPISINP